MIHIYRFFLVLTLALFAWAFVFSIIALINESLSILLNLDDETFNVDISNPRKWAILSIIYFVILIMLLYSFSAQLHHIFGMNLEVIERAF
jgi:hypothetical protein